MAPCSSWISYVHPLLQDLITWGMFLSNKWVWAIRILLHFLVATPWFVFAITLFCFPRYDREKFHDGVLIWSFSLSCREDATRNDLDLRDHGPQTPSSLTTLTLSKTAPLLYSCIELELRMLMPVSVGAVLFYLLIVNRELLSGDKEGLLQLPSDKALLSDPAFRPLVEKYAAVCRSSSLLVHVHIL